MNHSEELLIPAQPHRKFLNFKFLITFFTALILGGIAYGGIWYYDRQSDQVSIPSFTPRVDDTANWKTYRNEQYGFEFKYPSKLTQVSMGQYIFAAGKGSSINLQVELEARDPDLPLKPFEVTTEPDLGGGSNQYAHVPLNKSSATQQLKFHSEYPYVDLNQILSTFKFTDPIQDWKTYRNDTFGFQVEYPSTWEALINDPNSKTHFSISLRDKKYFKSFEWPGLTIENLDDIGATTKTSNTFDFADAIDDVIRIKTIVGGKAIYSRCALYLDPNVIENCNKILSTFKFTN